MPNGGQIPGSSPGLRLQANSPGVVDIGNANISGILIGGTGNFPGPAGSGTLRNFTGDHDIPANGARVNTIIGDNASITWLGSNPLLGCVVIGAKALAAQSITNQYQGNIAIGGESQCWASGGVAIGFRATCGTSTDLGNQAHVVIGGGAGVVNYGGLSSGAGISLGNGVTQITTLNATHGGMNSTLIGSFIHEVRDADPGYAIGNNIVLATPASIINIAATENMILLDTGKQAGYFAENFDTTHRNLIKIGDTSHQKILIAGKDLTNIGATRTLADVATTATNQDGTIIYSSITAARIVTLPAANTCPLGFRLLVLDQSGSASGVNTITLTRTGADTINGATTAAIILPYGLKELVTDGVSKWTVIRSI